MEWINIDDELPESGKIILVCDEYNYFISLGKYDESIDEIYVMHIDLMEIDYVITHWMPLPNQPERLNDSTFEKEDAIV